MLHKLFSLILMRGGIWGDEVHTTPLVGMSMDYCVKFQGAGTMH